MATVGQTITNPVAGDTVRYLRLPAGDVDELVVEMTTMPGGQGPPMHIHPRSSETFSVQSGSIIVRQSGREIILRPGESHTIPAGTPHTFASHGNAPAVTEVSFDQPGQMAQFLETFYELSRAGRTDAEGKPSMLQIAVTFSALANDIRTVLAPWPAQRLLFTILGPIGRLRGLRPFYAMDEL
jgi:quercetin dioxygenase-like cupin family protein